MTEEELREVFEDSEDEFGEFSKIENPPSKRRDICAFLKLDSLLPSEKVGDIIGWSEHDEFGLDIDLEELAGVATKDDILYLIRCGVIMGEHDSLTMFA